MSNRNLFALDIETTGVDRFKDQILCIGVWSPNEQHCFRSVSEFVEWHSADNHYIMHSGSFDVNFLRHNGADVSAHFAFDTKSIGSILIPIPRIAEGQKRSLSLENLSMVLLGRNSYKLDRTNMASYSWDELRNYNLTDCQYTYELYQYYLDNLSDEAWVFIDKWIMPATRLCMDLEFNGVAIDEVGLQQYQTEMRDRRDKILEELNEMAKPALVFFHEQQVRDVSEQYREMYEKAKDKAKDKTKCLNRYALLESAAVSRLQPFNWNSSTQLQWLLRDYYCLDIRSDREDKETTNEAMLKTLDHPVAQKLCEYREVEKMCSTCIPALLENSENSIVYASYNIGGTRTGRLSSSGPNLQQIPRGRIRSFIRSSVSKTLCTIDYSQIEVRIIAELAKERELIDAFKNKIDPYSVIAQKLLKIDCDVREVKEKFKKERDVSKTAGLSILYGTGAAKLQEVLNKELNENYSLTECKRFIEDYRKSLPGVAELRKRLERALANQKVCYNLLGRPFYIESNDEIYMKGLNTLVQGSASDLVIWSQTNFVIPALKSLGVDFKHRMLIHDEVVIELAEDEAEVLVAEVIIPSMTSAVERSLGLQIPLAVEYTISKQWEKP